MQIDQPYSDLRDGYINDLPEIPKKYWYAKDNQLTKRCRKEAKKLLVELYHATFLFEHERQALQRILVDAIEQGNEYYASRDTPNRDIDEAFGIDLKGRVRKITDPDELAQLEDTRPFEQ